jgi:AcrR family transcriptional regulator
VVATSVSVSIRCYNLKVFVSETEELDLTGERILDAALAQFERDGIRRSSVEAVARRAGVTRVTVYRRFPRKEALVDAVAAREARRLIAAADQRFTALPGAEERIVEGFTFLLRETRSHPLTRRLLAVEPEAVLPALTLEAGPVLEVGIAYVAEQIRRGQGEGALPAYDPEPVAELLVRFAHSALLAPRAAIDLDDERAVRAFARDHLTPILKRGS